MPLVPLENYKNIHSGDDIYILASGPSLNFINPSFFDNKITIGINQIYKYVKPKYLLRKEIQFIEEIIKGNIDLIHFISNGPSGTNNMKNRELYEKLKDKYPTVDVCCFNHNQNKLQLPDTLPSDGLVVSYSTITSAIHLAAYMGAKNIILVGHDCGTLDEQANLSNYHTKETIQVVWKNENDYVKWVSNDIEQHTIKLKKILKENYGCEVYSLNPFINFGLEGHVYKKNR